IGLALTTIPAARGPAIWVTRGALSWHIAVPEDGAMAYDGAFPTIIEWPEGAHPATGMPDLGCSLVRFEVIHPEADAIAANLAPYFRDARVAFASGAAPRLSAIIRTPDGERAIGQTRIP